MFDGSNVNDLSIFPNLPLLPNASFLLCYQFKFTTFVKLNQGSPKIIWND